MIQDDWVALVEHLTNPLVGPIDGICIQMLALESELQGQGIETSFVPFRPGESTGYTRTLAQPLYLMVHVADLERARQVARDLELEFESSAMAEFTEPAD